MSTSIIMQPPNVDRSQFFQHTEAVHGEFQFALHHRHPPTTTALTFAALVVNRNDVD